MKIINTFKDKKINLFDRNGLIFGFNKLNDGDFLSAAPAVQPERTDPGTDSPWRRYPAKTALSE